MTEAERKLLGIAILDRAGVIVTVFTGVDPVAGITNFKQELYVAWGEAWTKVVEQTDSHMEPKAGDVHSLTLTRVLPPAINKDVTLAPSAPLEDFAKLGESYALCCDRCASIEELGTCPRKRNCRVKSFDTCTPKVMTIQRAACVQPIRITQGCVL